MTGPAAFALLEFALLAFSIYLAVRLIHALNLVAKMAEELIKLLEERDK